MVKKAAAVFISGKGSNLKTLLLNSNKYNLPIKIKLVVSSSKKAAGLTYAKKWSIPYIIFNNTSILNEIKLLNELKSRKITFLCLAGYMRILSKNFIKKFNNTIINIHPSLLPKYKGLNTHQRALKAKEKYSGCTIHFVNQKLDSGKIIAKKKVKIFKKDTLKKLEKRVLKEENKLYPLVLEKLVRS